MKKLLIVLGMFSLFLFSCTYAQAYTINFDVLPNGDPVGSPWAISDQYISWGVTFSGYNLPYATAWASPNGEFASSPNILIYHENNPWYPIYMDFVSPHSGSVNFALISVGDSEVTSSLLGSDFSTVIDSVAVTNPGTDRGLHNINLVTLSGNDIYRVKFETTIPWERDGWGVDDISFGPGTGVVPEPASLSFLGLGLLGFVFKRRKIA